MAAPSRPGSFHLFRFRGVDVFVHYTWFLMVWYLVSQRRGAYGSIGWNIAECLGLFAIVLVHEFGHVLACRQTGGRASEIVLWPLGGLALVQPPPRAKAELWTIAAGPLVNVVFYPVLYFATEAAAGSAWGTRVPELPRFLYVLWELNTTLLLFNLLPIFPLDGGQILRSLLWLRVGRARSLHIAAIIGLVGIPIWVVTRLRGPGDSALWAIVMAVFLGAECVRALRHARMLRAVEQLPVRQGFHCPSCAHAPPEGPLWRCASCGHEFDVFWNSGACPHCTTRRETVPCVHCAAEHPLEAWAEPSARP